MSDVAVIRKTNSRSQTIALSLSWFWRLVDIPRIIYIGKTNDPFNSDYQIFGATTQHTKPLSIIDSLARNNQGLGQLIESILAWDGGNCDFHSCTLACVLVISTEGSWNATLAGCKGCSWSTVAFSSTQKYGLRMPAHVGSWGKVHAVRFKIGPQRVLGEHGKTHTVTLPVELLPSKDCVPSHPKRIGDD